MSDNFDNLNVDVPVYSEIKIVKDEDGHTYIIPVELEWEFDSTVVDATMYGDYNKFIERFSMYMRNPADVKLYMREN